MADKEFNLLHEPWISVMKSNGTTKDVSLLNLFRYAQEYRGLAGELPTQDVAVLRLLLAILHAVFSRYDFDGKFTPLLSPGDALSRWKALWDRGEFPIKIIEDYLLNFEDRFWLFHPERPFYQVASLCTRDDKFGPFEASKLNGELAQSDHKVRLFPQRMGEEKNKLNYSEAARWLLHINAFSETFGKLEAKGKSAKNLFSLGVGWLGKLGLIISIGDNLYETLLLNLVLLKDGSNELWGKEKPIWEVGKVKEAELNVIVMPDNPSELLTLQSRRLLLLRENGYVTGYSLLSGDFFSKENAFSEQMTVWKNLAKKDTDPPKYSPRRHDPSRQLWRDFPSLVAQSAGKRRPGVVSWLSRLKSEHLISLSHFSFQTMGVSYGTMEAVIDDTFSDSLSFSTNLLTDLGEDWVSRIIAELDTTEKLVEQIGYLAQNLAKAAGNTDGGDQKAAAMEQAYFRLDNPFREWLEGIDPEHDEKEETCLSWLTQAKQIVLELGKDLVSQAGPQAFVGHDVKESVKGKEVKRLYTAPNSYNYFLSKTSNPEALKGGNKNG